MRRSINRLTLALIHSLQIIIPPASAALAADPNSSEPQSWTLSFALDLIRQSGYSPPTMILTSDAHF
jgi:hypothetical protein